MKNFSAKSIFGTILSIFLLASCIKKDPEFKNAFKDINPDALTMTYTWNATPGGLITPVNTNPVTNMPVHQEAKKEITNSTLPLLRPETKRKVW